MIYLVALQIKEPLFINFSSSPRNQFAVRYSCLEMQRSLILKKKFALCEIPNVHYIFTTGSQWRLT